MLINRRRLPGLVERSGAPQRWPVVNAAKSRYFPCMGRWFANPSDADLEHMVARSEVRHSGLWAAALATRRRFATDPMNFTLAGPRVNRYEKVDRAATEWLSEQNCCLGNRSRNCR